MLYSHLLWSTWRRMLIKVSLSIHFDTCFAFITFLSVEWKACREICWEWQRLSLYTLSKAHNQRDISSLPLSIHTKLCCAEILFTELSFLSLVRCAFRCLVIFYVARKMHLKCHSIDEMNERVLIKVLDSRTNSKWRRNLFREAWNMKSCGMNWKKYEIWNINDNRNRVFYLE